VEFQSIIDGSLHFLSPEKSIQIQNNIGADIIFALDECTSPHASYEYLKEAMERTHRWAQRSLATRNSSEMKNRQALFGIVQGGRHKDLREESARTIGAMELAPYGAEGSRSGFDGFGIGGSFVKEDMANAVKWVNEILPKEKPRHLLGVGEPVDLFGAVENGCDLFDCVSPTRIARNGNVYTGRGRVNLLNQKFRDDSAPIDAGCRCYTCRNYSRAYVAHLFRGKEMLAATLASIHNLHFIINMVDRMRETIPTGDFMAYKKDFLAKYYAGYGF
jgi:queuine tRNA-ribosyltransferase